MERWTLPAFQIERVDRIPPGKSQISGGGSSPALILVLMLCTIHCGCRNNSELDHWQPLPSF